jgi:DNA uptake protein ComE-like DNA-binding protein
VLAYRLQHGPYANVEDLLKIKIFKPEWVEKIAPYLRFEVLVEKVPEK